MTPVFGTAKRVLKKRCFDYNLTVALKGNSLNIKAHENSCLGTSGMPYYIGMEQQNSRRLAWWFVLAAALAVLVFVIIKVINPDSVSAPQKSTAQAKQAPLTSQPKPQPTLDKTRFVALYGTPGAPVLGTLGSYGNPADAMDAAKKLAADYQAFSAEPIKPTLEIITTIASASPTENGDYSREIEIATLQPWVDAAKQAGVYVVLDLQPGRTDFSAQAKLYEPLLREPHVGLALDPEWRLYGDEKPMIQIGSVSAAEVNETGKWLSEITKRYDLPQKLFLLHQFRMDMLTDRGQIDTSRPELTTVIQMDGQGAQNVKQDTWRVLTTNPPAGIRFGWKNFYQKDPVVLSPQETMAVTPKPWYVSYQ